MSRNLGNLAVGGIVVPLIGGWLLGYTLLGLDHEQSPAPTREDSAANQPSSAERTQADREPEEFVKADSSRGQTDKPTVDPFEFAKKAVTDANPHLRENPEECDRVAAGYLLEARKAQLVNRIRISDEKLYELIVLLSNLDRQIDEATEQMSSAKKRIVASKEQAREVIREPDRYCQVGSGKLVILERAEDPTFDACLGELQKLRALRDEEVWKYIYSVRGR